MDFDEQKLYSDMIVGYRQRLDVATYELERLKAQSAQKDQHIAKLTSELEAARPPKPGPR